MAGRFSDLFRLASKRTKVSTSTPPVYENKRMLYTEQEGVWLAGMRSPNKSMGAYPITEDTHKFWHDLEKASRGEKF